MWATPEGIRTLKGAEAELIKALIASVAFDLELSYEEGGEMSFGVGEFDQLQFPQQLSMLAAVGSALLLETVNAPQLTAVNEATVAVLFVALKEQVMAEIANETLIGIPDKTHWRKLVLAAARECEDADLQLPRRSSQEINAWEFVIEALADAIIWDHDWAMSNVVMDLPPDHADELKEMLTIDEDYYLAVAPDPTDAQLAEIREVLKRLTVSLGA